MATSTYDTQNVIVSLTTSDGSRDFNMHSGALSQVEDKAGGGSTITFVAVPPAPSESDVSGTTVNAGNSALTVDVTESVADIDALVTAAGGTVVT